MEIQGKYNKAKIFTNNIDSTTISQIINLCNQKEFKDSIIRIMPDCHAGKGCTIGTTMTITDKIVPNLVGVDIGCGMASIKLKDELDLNRLDNVIREYVPHGFSIHKRSREKLLKEVFNIDLKQLKCEVNLNRIYMSVGTLGGGNHFIEVNKDCDGSLYLVVHTGSRNLGKQIAEYYQKKAVEYCKTKYENEVKETILLLKEQGLEKEINSKLKEIINPSDDLCYLEKELMIDYLHDMDIAQKFANANRIVILSDIIYNYYQETCKYEVVCKDVKDKSIECTHNYIDIENMILRKGAISAKENEMVIIPINMRDGIILGMGKGNSDWNYSAPHGAGRILSRGQAKEKISLDEFKDSMKDVFTTCIGQSTLDEAPQAYKPINDIVDNITDTVEIIDILKPIYNFKSN